MNRSDENSAASWPPILSGIVLITGFALILVSLFWPTSSMSRGGWTAEQAQQYQAASVKLHTLSHAVLHPAPDTDPGAKQKEFKQAESEYKTIRAQLDSAIDRPNQWSHILRFVGAAFIVVGGIGLYFTRPTLDAGRH